MLTTTMMMHKKQVQQTDETAATQDDAAIPHSEKVLTMERQQLVDEAEDDMYKTPEKLVLRRRVTPTLMTDSDEKDKFSMKDDVADEFKGAVDPLKDQEIIFAYFCRCCIENSFAQAGKARANYSWGI